MNMDVNQVSLNLTRYYITKALSCCEPECHNPFMRVVYHLLMTALNLLNAKSPYATIPYGSK